MYIIENQNGELVRRMNANKNVLWSERVLDKDGEEIQPRLESANANGVEVGATQTLADGTVLTLHRVEERRDTTAGSARVIATKPIEKVGDEWVRVTKYGPALPPPPIDPENYREDRARELLQTIGEGSRDVLIGEHLDALLKLMVTLRIERANIQKATTIAGLKAILDRIADLPPEMDQLIGQWTAAKNKFPKPSE